MKVYLALDCQIQLIPQRHQHYHEIIFAQGWPVEHCKTQSFTPNSSAGTSNKLISLCVRLRFAYPKPISEQCTRDTQLGIVQKSPSETLCIKSQLFVKIFCTLFQDQGVLLHTSIVYTSHPSKLKGCPLDLRLIRLNWVLLN